LIVVAPSPIEKTENRRKRGAGMKKQKNQMGERAKKYLNGCGASCLFCDYEHVEGLSWNMDGMMVSQEVFCPKCEKANEGRDWRRE
jgi:hypothetical protein